MSLVGSRTVGRPEELAALVAGGEWTTTGTRSYASAPAMMLASSEMPTYNKDKLLLSLERRLREVPPLARIAPLNEMIAAAVDELSDSQPHRHGHTSRAANPSPAPPAIPQSASTGSC